MEKKAPRQEDHEIFKVLKPAVAVDVVLFRIHHQRLQVGLIKREDEPYFGKYALPGRFVRYDEPIEETAKWALENKCGIQDKDIYLTQLYAFGQNLTRDTRIRTISIVYYALISPRQNENEQKKITWKDIDDIPSLAFDHEEIIRFSIRSLKEKLFINEAIFSLLPAEFTLSEMQAACESILGTSLDKRNFRKKISEVFVLKDLKKKKMQGAHRPATLYSFVRMQTQ